MPSNHEYQFRLAYIRLLIKQSEGKSIAIWGAGEHTVWLLNEVFTESEKKQVKCIIDDNPKVEKMINIPVLTPDKASGFDLIIISSDSYEDILSERARSCFGDKFPIICPYKEIATGPFCKPAKEKKEPLKKIDEPKVDNDKLIEEKLKSAGLVATEFSLDSETAFATVEQYNRYLDLFPELCFLSGDTKNVERGWIAETILKQIPRGGKILEIGGDCCLVADYFQKRGYEVWNVDPYLNYGGGVGEFEKIKEKYPDINIIRAFLKDANLPENYFDAVYSISVLEHVSVEDLRLTFNKCRDILKTGGTSVHAVDYCIHGPGGLMENHDIIQAVIEEHDVEIINFEDFKENGITDIETLFLSPTAHFKWREFNKKEYPDYPFRKVCVLNINAALRERI